MFGTPAPSGGVHPPINIRGDVVKWGRRRCDAIIMRDAQGDGRWIPWFARVFVFVVLRISEEPYPKLAVVRSYEAVPERIVVAGRSVCVLRTLTKHAVRAVDIEVIDGPTRLFPYFDGKSAGKPLQTAGEFAFVLSDTPEEGGRV